MLMPAFAFFFPLTVSIAATAVVHLANNIFKVFLLGKHADLKVVLVFAVPASFSAAAGALLLRSIANIQPLAAYQIAGRQIEIRLVNVVVAVMIGFFSVLELAPRFREVKVSRRYMPLGGVLSGFFGGLSGHQGALRTAFLIRIGLKKEAFLATVAVSAVVVDVTRLVVYGLSFWGKHFSVFEERAGVWLLAAGIVSALAGSLVATRLLPKITLSNIKILVGILLLVLAAGIGAGLV